MLFNPLYCRYMLEAAENDNNQAYYAAYCIYRDLGMQKEGMRLLIKAILDRDSNAIKEGKCLK